MDYRNTDSEWRRPTSMSKGLVTMASCLIITYIIFVVTFNLGAAALHNNSIQYEPQKLLPGQTKNVNVIWASLFFLEYDIASHGEQLYLILEKKEQELTAVRLSDIFGSVLLFSNAPLILMLFLGFIIPFYLNERCERRFLNSIVHISRDVSKLLSTLNLEPSNSSKPYDVNKLCSHLQEIDRKIRQNKREHELHNNQDKLTGLIDRHTYLEHLGAQLELARTTKTQKALLFIDLDGFKQVNDSFGHSFGDEVLIQVAHRLATVVRNHSLSTANQLTQQELNLSRLGGDEFSIFIEDLSDKGRAVDVARNVLKEIERDFVLGNKIIKIGASIGVAVYPDSASEPNTLLQMADVAMYRAKTDGRGVYRVYSPEMGSKIRRYHYLLEELRLAVANQSFSLSFQPIVSVNGCTINYFETLVRWNHPVEGSISPSEFIPIAEDSNLILELGSWILQEACRQMSAWYNAGMTQVKISVNISGIQLKHVSIYPWTMEILSKTGLPPQALLLEVTESCFIDASDELIAGFEQLRAQGVQIAIDDFGTGFSSLSTLANLPVDIIKIDRLFIEQANINPKYDKILTSISELGKTLSLKIVAEGVETASQFELVKRLGIHCVQGYLISQPESSNTVGTKMFTGNINHISQTGTGVWGIEKSR